MSNKVHINEEDLDGALNALFLETYSQKTDEDLARYVMEQEYDIVFDAKKEAELLAKLGTKRGGNRKIFLLTITLLLFILAIIMGIILFSNKSTIINKNSSAPKDVSEKYDHGLELDSSALLKANDEVDESIIPIITSPVVDENNTQNFPVIDSLPLSFVNALAVSNDITNGKTLPYFDKEGITFFGKIKDQMLMKLIKIDEQMYVKTEPGTTMYKNKEIIVFPYVMSSFPVTNLQYKAFLADLVVQGRIEDFKKCLPKEEMWKEYGCTVLAKNYFGSESYNNFPVVNVSKEACNLFCKWLEDKINQELEVVAKNSKGKAEIKKKQVTVRLPYDYEWIYSVDAAYALMPECNGYNTIYDASEGLVDKDFFKNTSQISKREKRKENRMEQLSNINRFGMKEDEMIAIYKEAMNFKGDKSKNSTNSSDPLSYPNNIEACCLAGHVCELINVKDGGTTVRGSCWKNKEEYLKMMEAYTKQGASPFVGFRVLILNAGKSTSKNPFW